MFLVASFLAFIFWGILLALVILIAFLLAEVLVQYIIGALYFIYLLIFLPADMYTGFYDWSDTHRTIYEEQDGIAALKDNIYMQWYLYKKVITKGEGYSKEDWEHFTNWKNT